MSALRYVSRRLLHAAILLFGVALLTFVLMHLNGDPVTLRLAESGASPAQIAEIKHSLGYDRPIMVQFGSYLADAVTGNFGNSVIYGGPALSLVLDKLPATMFLAVTAMLTAVLLALPLGFLPGRHPGGVIDRISLAVTSLFLAVPSFVFGAVLILVFGVMWTLLPIASPHSTLGFVMPMLALSTQPAARLARMLRAQMIERRASDYVTFARSRGLSRWHIDIHYVFRTSLSAVVTVLGLHLAVLLGGALVIETMFSWPGIGRLTATSLANADFNVVQVIILLIGGMVILVNFGLDVAYRFLDPRVQID